MSESKHDGCNVKPLSIFVAFGAGGKPSGGTLLDTALLKWNLA
jgi:hypothetical protein